MSDTQPETFGPEEETFDVVLKNEDNSIVSAEQFRATSAFVMAVLTGRKDYPHHYELWALKGENRHSFSDVSNDWMSVTRAESQVVVPGDHAKLEYDMKRPTQMRLYVTFNAANEPDKPGARFASVQIAKQVLNRAHTLSSLHRR